MDRVLDGLRILVVEDDSPSLTLATTVLRLAGATVTGETDGESAVTRAISERFDAILMDVQLPAIDGCEATMRIRAHEADGGGPRPGDRGHRPCDGRTPGGVPRCRDGRCDHQAGRSPDVRIRGSRVHECCAPNARCVLEVAVLGGICGVQDEREHRTLTQHALDRDLAAQQARILS